jgi:hypothetical protein
MQVRHQDEQWRVDGRDVLCEPFRQVDVRHRAALRTVALSQLGQRAAEPVGSEHERFPDDDAGGDTHAFVRAPCEPGVKDVHDA